MKTRPKKTDFSEAVKRAMQVRKLYNQLEQQKHGGAWTNQEDMIGFVYDVGELGRMVMAAEGRWVYQGDLSKDLDDKLAECLWWPLVLSGRLGIDQQCFFFQDFRIGGESFQKCEGRQAVSER